MSTNILNLIKDHLGPAVISQASTRLGESESGISKAISAFLPTVLGGFANNADKPGIIDSIMGASSDDLLGNPMEDSHNSISTTILTALFGDKLSSIVNSVAGFAGISNASSSSLLNMTTSVTTGTLGKYASEHNLGAAELSNVLADQKGVVSNLLPAGLTLATLGLGHWSQTETIVPPVPENVTVTSFEEPKVDVTRGGETHMNVEPDNNDNGGSIWKWLLPLILVLLACWFIWDQYNKNNAETTTVTNTDSTMMKSDSMNTAMMTDSTTMNASPRTDTDIDLNGTMIKGYKGGMEDNMIAFLKANKYKDAANDSDLKDTWYNFDKVNFEMASATQLLPGSEEQMKNLVAILKAYPDTKIKIGGYTDNVGDPSVNKELSQKRADFLRNQLASMGVGSQVTGAEGFGSDKAAVPATASDAARSVDRNMAVRFTK